MTYTLGQSSPIGGDEPCADVPAGNHFPSRSGRLERRGFGAEGEALFISNLRDQLGLRLTATTGPVDYWVVDHAELPTEN